LALHENLVNAQPGLYEMGLAGLSRPVQVVACTYQRCTSSEAHAGLRPITPPHQTLQRLELLEGAPPPPPRPFYTSPTHHIPSPPQFLDVKGKFVTSFEHASGNMDAAGTAQYIHWLRAIAPGQFENALLTEDGDSKSRSWDYPGWNIGKCKCHKGKSLPVCLNRKISGIVCTCRNTGSKSCVNITAVATRMQ